MAKSYIIFLANNSLSFSSLGFWHKSDFWNTFPWSPEKPQILPEQCFSGSKALLLSRKSIAFHSKKHCSALVPSIFFTKSSKKVF